MRLQLFFDEFLKTAGSTSSNAFTEAEKHHLMQSDVAQASLAAPTLFFRLVRHGPGDVVRPKSKGELAFSASDVVVTLHTLMAANHSSKESEVSSSLHALMIWRRKRNRKLCSHRLCFRTQS